MQITIFGATSAIATATARVWAGQGADFTLIARDAKRLEVLEADLLARGAGQVACQACDLANLTELNNKLNELVKQSAPDVLLLAQGVLPDQAKCLESFEEFQKNWTINFSSLLLIIKRYLNELKKKANSTIVIIGSVAGDRGRKSNFAYGTAKGALEIYSSGLRNCLHESGIKVLLVKPGFVDTPMTANLKKGALFAQPETVAGDIVRAVEAGKDVLYTPWFWRWIMLIIKMIPEKIFKRLSL